MRNKKYYQYTLKFLDFLIENNKKSPQIITNKSYFQCSIKYIFCVLIFIKKHSTKTSSMDNNILSNHCNFNKSLKVSND